MLLVQRTWRRAKAKRGAHVQLLLLLWEKVVEEQKRQIAETEALGSGSLDALLLRRERDRERKRTMRGLSQLPQQLATLYSPPQSPNPPTAGTGASAAQAGRKFPKRGDANHKDSSQTPANAGAASTATAPAVEPGADLDAHTLVRLDKKFLITDKKRILTNFVRKRRLDYLEAVRQHKEGLKKYIQDHNLGELLHSNHSIIV